MSRPCARAILTLALATLAVGASPRAAFAFNVRANDPLPGPLGSTNSGAAIAMDGMHVVVAWTEGRSFGVYQEVGATGYATSTDGGLTFTDGGYLSSIYGTDDGDPALATDHAGNFYVVSKQFGYDPESPWHVLHVRRGSFTGGAFAWSDPVYVVPNSSLSDVYTEPSLEADPVDGTLYMSWTRWVQGGLSGSRIEFARSTDQGATWSAPILIAGVSFPTNPHVRSSRVAVGPDRSIVVLYLRHTNPVGPSMLHSRRSVSAGVSFGAEATLPVPSGGAQLNVGSGPPGSNVDMGFSRPSLAIDWSDGPRRGRVYAAWEAGVNFLVDPLGTLGSVAETEPNDGTGSADALTIGATANGSLPSSTDQDWYAFSGTAGQTLVAHSSSNVGWGVRLHLYGGAGGTSDQLAHSRTGPYDCHIVFTLPSTGTYWLRVEATSGSNLAYQLATGWHPHGPDDIGRDSRDVVVMSSANGSSWDPARTIVNDDPRRYDNAMPEVAVDDAGRVHVSWYDHRDDAADGQLTNVYRAFSDDGGATFSPNAKLNDGPATNYATQGNADVSDLGEHAALAADGCRVLAAFTDGRGGTPDVWTQVIFGVSAESSTTTLAQSAEWTDLDSPVTLTATVSPVGAFGFVQFTDGGEPLGAPVPVDGGTGQAQLVTSELAEATHEIGAGFSGYGCLAASDATPVTHFVGEAGVSVDGGPLAPDGPDFAITGITPNPTTGQSLVTLELRRAADVRLTLLDLQGRVTATLVDGELPAGRHKFEWTVRRLHSGLYFLSLEAPGTRALRRAVLAR